MGMSMQTETDRCTKGFYKPHFHWRLHLVFSGNHWFPVNYSIYFLVIYPEINVSSSAFF